MNNATIKSILSMDAADFYANLGENPKHRDIETKICNLMNESRLENDEDALDAIEALWKPFKHTIDAAFELEDSNPRKRVIGGKGLESVQTKIIRVQMNRLFLYRRSK
jgi:hypothetical protein